MIVILESGEGKVYKASEVQHAKTVLVKGVVYRAAMASNAGKVLGNDADRHLRRKACNSASDLLVESIKFEPILAELGLPMTLFDVCSAADGWENVWALLTKNAV